MEPYLVCVFLRPTPKEREDSKSEEMVVDGKVVLAKDTSHAGTKALRLVPKEYENVDDRLEVRILPFQKCCK